MYGCLLTLFLIGFFAVLIFLQKFWFLIKTLFSLRKSQQKANREYTSRQRPGEWVHTKQYGQKKGKIISEDEGEYTDYTEIKE